MRREHWAILAVALTGLCTATWAQAPKLEDGRGQVTLTWNEFVKITGYDPAKKGAQVLTVPWAEVEKLIGVKVEGKIKGATVDLPWAEFKALLEWSIHREGKDASPPPTDFIVASSRYAGALGEKAAAFTLTAKLNILRQKGWKTIPLLPQTVALTKVTLPEGVFLHAGGKSYDLLTDKTGEIDVTIEFSVAVTTSGGIRQTTFQRVLPGSSLLELAFDREDVDAKVANAQSMVTKVADKAAHVAAALPSAAAVAVSWERALPKVPPAPTKLYAETRTLVAVAEGLLLCQETVNYNILHTAVRELSLQVPQNASVLTVSGANLQDWRVDDAGKLQVVLKAEVVGSYALSLAYEQPSQADAAAPVVHPLGVERERGFVGVVAVANVEIAAGQVQGATAIDVRQLPGDIVSMTNQPILLAFRHLGSQFTIPLTIRKHEEVGVLVTIVDSAAFTAMQLADGRRITKATYSVRNNRNQFLRLTMPAGSEIWSVSVGGNTVSPAKDSAGSVLVPLVRSARGGQELAAFPVEIVFVEAPQKAVPEKGTMHVTLPVCTVPVMHVMYSYYVPAEGDYTVGWGESGFSGPLKVVKEFASLSTGAGTRVIAVNAAKQAQEMQKAFDAKVDARARVAGATPIRVRLPINGTLFKLEKVLALPNDKLFFDLRYSGWQTEE